MRVLGSCWGVLVVAVFPGGVCLQCETVQKGNEVCRSNTGFTAVIVGESGAGKSTMSNVILGHEHFATTTGMDACTEATVCKSGVFLFNRNPAVQDVAWRVIDTPGFGDSKAERDIPNMGNMTQQLIKAGNIDAVILVYKLLDNTVSKLGPHQRNILFKLRLAFGPGVWRRLIIGYSFATWLDWKPPMPRKCVVHDDLEGQHTQFMARIRSSIREELGAEDPDCLPDDASPQECFPLQTPWFANSMSMEDVKTSWSTPEYGMFDPEKQSEVSYGCHFSTMASEYAHLANIAGNMSSLPMFQVPRVNLYVVCKRAQDGLEDLKSKIGDSSWKQVELKQVARHIVLCCNGEITREKGILEKNWAGAMILQFHLAFEFHKLDAGNLLDLLGLVPRYVTDTYNDVDTYMTCTDVVDQPDQRLLCLAKLRMYQTNHSNVSTEAAKYRQQVIDTLQFDKTFCHCKDVDNKERGDFYCDHGVKSSCGDHYVCAHRILGVKYKITDPHDVQDKICEKAKQCGEVSDICGAYGFENQFLKDKYCSSSRRCRADECCSMKQKFLLKSFQRPGGFCLAMSPTWDHPEVWPCNETDTLQQWQWMNTSSNDDEQKLLQQSESQKCLERVPDYYNLLVWHNPTLILKDCKPIVPHQRFQYKDHHVYMRHYQEYLDVYGAKGMVAKGIHAALWYWRTGANQKWTTQRILEAPQDTSDKHELFPGEQTTILNDGYLKESKCPLAWMIGGFCAVFGVALWVWRVSLKMMVAGSQAMHMTPLVHDDISAE